MSEHRVFHVAHNSGRAAHSLRSWPFAGDGFGGKSIVHEGGFGSRPSAGPAAREALDVMPWTDLPNSWSE